MAVPSGDSPEDVRDINLYLQGHHATDGPVVTWHVNWLSIAWLWGFVAVLTFGILLWVRQYRSTRQPNGIYSVDTFGGWTTEAAGPATVFFWLLTAVLTGFAVAMVVGHLIWGQKY
jgi:hypothetical protein